MAVKTLTWSQVNAWRLSQHGLFPRLARQEVLEAVTRTGGIQAQVMTAAEQALWARVDGLAAQDVRAALWQEPTLVKTWAMRSTLHLLRADELPLYVAARSADEPRNWEGYFGYYGVTPPQLEAYLEAAGDVLGSEPMTREELAAALGEHTGIPALRNLLVSMNWGTPLKPLAWRGDLCFGPSKGQNVTFVNPKKWLGEWHPVEPTAALREIARRYLRAYGPATVEEFTLWWGMRLTPARQLFRSLADELETVEVEGRPALLLRESLEVMHQGSQPRGVVNLLPLFDAYVMGIGRGAGIAPLLPLGLQRQVYRPQGWISAVVLADGYLRGVWELKTGPAQALVKVRLFSSPDASLRRGIATEAERLGGFLNAKVAVEIDY